MILDTLDQAARYEALNSRFAKAFAYLEPVPRAGFFKPSTSRRDFVEAWVA
jgi:hypothetical protein